MQRRPWFEFHDHRFFPAFLRDMVTDGLQAMWNAENTYAPIVPRLRQAMAEAGTRRIVDLCSGAGGPWRKLIRDFARGGGWTPQVLLTDRFPNRTAFERLRREADLQYCPEPVNATRIPSELTGFRTIFTSFHHFDPGQARAILRNAFDARQGIAVFDAATREPRTLLAVFLVPLLSLLLTPGIRPFRWSRLFFTYLLPVIPFVLWVDGVLSCLRSYSPDDFLELVSEFRAADYVWEAGVERGRIVAIAYLIGRRRPHEAGSAEEESSAIAQIEKPA